MTKDQLQKEIKDKVKPGVKPSDLKKLKRSKSEGDIPKAPPLPTSTPLKKSQSQLEASLTQPSSKQQITQLQEQVKFHAETASNYLKSLQVSQAKVSELEEKLKNKPLSQLEELDQSLMARHQNLKDWFSQYQKTKQLDTELKENIDEASTELIEQDKMISQLRGEVRSLQKDLQLTNRLAEMRKTPFPGDENNYLKYALYSLLAVGFTVWLVKSFKNIRESPNYD